MEHGLFYGHTFYERPPWLCDDNDGGEGERPDIEPDDDEDDNG